MPFPYEFTFQLWDAGAQLNGEITDTEENCDYRGFVWDRSSHSDPGDTAPDESDYYNNWTESGDYGTGTFSRDVTPLIPNETYYFRACAHNPGGWSYGSEESFTTPKEPSEAGAIIDTNTSGVVLSTSASRNTISG